MLSQPLQRLHDSDAAGQGGDARNTVHHGCRTYATFVRPSPLAVGSIEDERNLLVRHVVQQVRSTFLKFLDRLHFQTAFPEDAGCAAGTQDVETHLLQLANLWNDGLLVSSSKADEHRTCLRQLGTGCNLTLRKRNREVVRNPHHFAGRFHFRTENDVDPDESIEREHALFDRGV